MSPDPYISPCLRIHVSASSNLRILCKIHVSDSCLSIHVAASLYLRILCKIHVSGRMSQHPYISQELLQDPCLRFMSYSILIIRFCGPAQAKRKFWPPETRFVWPCAEKTVRPRSAGAFRAGETQILSSGGAFCVALRRENSPTECFAQAKRKCRDAFFVALRRRNANFTSGDASCVHIMWIHEEPRLNERKSPRRYSETQKKNSSRRAKRKFWPPEWRFLWPCAMKNEETRNLHLDLRGFTPTVRTPQCDTLFGESQYI